MFLSSVRGQSYVREKDSAVVATRRSTQKTMSTIVIMLVFLS